VVVNEARTLGRYDVPLPASHDHWSRAESGPRSGIQILNPSTTVQYSTSIARKVVDASQFELVQAHGSVGVRGHCRPLNRGLSIRFSNHSRKHSVALISLTRSSTSRCNPTALDRPLYLNDFICLLQARELSRSTRD